MVSQYTMPPLKSSVKKKEAEDEDHLQPFFYGKFPGDIFITVMPVFLQVNTTAYLNTLSVYPSAFAAA
jgi:hypothetical protein